MPIQPFSSIVATPATPGADDSALLRARVTDDWLQGRAAFGGLQGALGALAMRAVVGDGPPPPTYCTAMVGDGSNDTGALKLSWSIHNASITRLQYDGDRVSLHSFNAVPHLERAELRPLLTYR